MKAKIKRVLNVDVKHYISLLLIVISFNFAEFFYQLSYERLIVNIINFCKVIKAYSQAVFTGQTELIIDILPANMFDIQRLINIDWERFYEKFENFKHLIFSFENILSYYRFITLLGSFLSMLICLGTLAFMLIKRFVDSHYLTRSEDENIVDSKQLKFFKNKIEPVLRRVYKATVSYKDFLLSHKVYIYALVIIWLLNFNLISLAIYIFTLYVSIVVSARVFATPDFVLNLIIEILITLIYVPPFLYIALFLYVYIWIRKTNAVNYLRRNEYRNRGMINEQSFSVLLVGTMGAKKTTTAVDMALSTAAMFRDKAREILYKYEMKFPNFQWLAYERDLRRCFDNHTIFNLASCKVYVEDLKKQFDEAETDEDAIKILFGYDFNKYRMFYDNKLEIVYLFDALETYAKAYLIYTVEGSLILANMSVREDFVFDNSNFFPEVDTDFLSKPSYDKYESNGLSKFARVFDYEMFRLGRKMLKDNENSNAFEFGVIVLTELGKERKNALENKELKKSTKEANQNNDLFNTRLKMLRHAATVDYYCFARLYADEQRPESLGADARDLCSVIDVSDCSELKFAYNGLLITRFFHDRICPTIDDFLKTVRVLRSDNSLLVYLIRNAISKFNDLYENNQNYFGYFTLNCNVTVSGRNKSYKYYLSKKKIHSGKFATDTHASVFENMALKSEKGFADFVPYGSLRQTEEELAMQNSYFYNEMKEWQ